MNEETKNAPQSNNKLLTALVVILLIVAVVQSVFMFSMYCGQYSKQDMSADEINNPPPPVAPRTAGRFTLPLAGREMKSGRWKEREVNIKPKTVRLNGTPETLTWF